MLAVKEVGRDRAMTGERHRFERLVFRIVEHAYLMERYPERGGGGGVAPLCLWDEIQRDRERHRRETIAGIRLPEMRCKEQKEELVLDAYSIMTGRAGSGYRYG